ncbi:ABC transporter substrate-binding protein [Benzoatithermus flavus]|uniref:ABC transporter substrate-binding protein n=1 Tax=Benzoatithermus flavus TaxID=3108223 RepID=UPI003AB03AB2
MVWAAAREARAEVRLGLAVPLTGHHAWNGSIVRNGFARAVADLNDAGGVLGQRVEEVVAGGYCDAERARAAARGLVAIRVAVVFGHQGSAAAHRCRCAIAGDPGAAPRGNRRRTGRVGRVPRRAGRAGAHRRGRLCHQRAAAVSICACRPMAGWRCGNSRRTASRSTCVSRDRPSSTRRSWCWMQHWTGWGSPMSRCVWPSPTSGRAAWCRC